MLNLLAIRKNTLEHSREIYCSPQDPKTTYNLETKGHTYGLVIILRHSNQ